MLLPISTLLAHKIKNFLTNNLKVCISDFVKTVSVNENNKPWFTEELYKQRREAGDAYRKAYYSDDQQDWLEYNRVSKIYSMNIKLLKNKHYHDRLFNAGNDQRKVWKILKSIISGVNETSEAIEFNGDIKTDEVEIAESFNRFFIDSIRELKNSIPSEIDQFPVTTKVKYECKFDIVDVDKIERFLNNIKSKSDTEFLNKSVLLDALPIIGSVFADVVNSSMEYSICPIKWKQSMVSPIPKVPGTVKCDEFRPINTLPTYEKILEEAVRESIDYHISDNQIVIEEQSGFRKNHSCESTLNLVIMNWKMEIENGKIVVAVFLDLKRAFETIDRSRLLQKLERLGIKGRELEWFKSYLSHRTQSTKFGGVVSTEADVDIGLPQGSKLAAILFILYINDIKECLQFLKLILFADDTLVYYSGSDIKEIEKKVNEDLERLSKWLNVNKLKLNVKKTKYMVISKSEKDEMKINL